MKLEEAIGKELRLLRVQKRMSQEQLAFSASVHRTYVSFVERGLKSPTLSVLIRLCQALEVKPDTFVKHIMARTKM